MRHSPTRRSLLSATGKGIRLADHQTDRPRHGGPLALSARSQQPHRVLRLAMVIGLAGAGFCLVLAMTGVVVALGAKAPRGPGSHSGSGRHARVDSKPETKAPRTSASHRRFHFPSSVPPIPAPVITPAKNGQAHADVVGLVIARYHGNESERRDNFAIGKPGDWGISWKYSCPRGQGSTFAIRAANGAAANSVELSASGRQGHGLSWSMSDPGTHSLIVTTSCDWVVKIVLPKT
jgi:hypothetical protein